MIFAVIGKSRLAGGFLYAVAVLGSYNPSKLIAEDPAVTPIEMAIWGPPPQTPHRVVRQPQWLSSEQANKRSIHDKFLPPVATIQAAAIEPVWRQPYAYGYFGPQPHRHPTRHFGYRKNYTQWVWK